jgi:dolichol-phosphate mannosyltransferase
VPELPLSRRTSNGEAMDAKIKQGEIVAATNGNGDQPVELAVVIPTFNERDNISPLLHRLATALDGMRWEAIFVDDDSPDGTADFVRAIAQQNPQVRIIRRIGRRGLASACVEGALSSSAPYFAVIDADMQHDETILPQMLERLKEEDLDLVVGSRYVEGGSVGTLDKRRRIISRLASRAARLVIKVELRDPMSGFFLMRRRAFDEAVRNLSQQGFKILLDLFASAPRPLRFAELSYHFRLRRHGESKLDGMAVWEYGMLLADKLFGQFIPTRLMVFGVVGGFGLLVHMATLAVALSLGLAFVTSQIIAAIASTSSNFTLNNVITYRDRRLKDWDLARGLLTFYIICSAGWAANVGVARLVYSEAPVWWLATLPGALIGVIWNYAMSTFFIWTRSNARVY